MAGAQQRGFAVGRETAPTAMAINPVTNRIYVTNSGDSAVNVIDGSNNTPTTFAVGTNPSALAVNPVSNKIYAVNSGSGNVSVIDGVTNTVTPVNVGTNPGAVAVNPVSNKTYVSNNVSANVTELTEQQVLPSPLTTSIT